MLNLKVMELHPILYRYQDHHPMESDPHNGHVLIRYRSNTLIKNKLVFLYIYIKL
jgi:hypothetical protein